MEQNGQPHDPAPEPEPVPQAQPEVQPEGYVLPGKGLKDSRMERRALRSRWGVPDEYKQAMLKRVVKNGLDPETSARNATQCLRALISAEQQDFEKDRYESGEVLNVNLQGVVQTEVVETHVRTREEASRLPPVNGTGGVPGLNGTH